MFKRRIAIFTLALALSANALILCSCGGKGKENATHGTEKPKVESTEDKDGMTDGRGDGEGGLVDDITDGIGDMTDGEGEIIGGATDNDNNKGNEGNMPDARRGKRIVNPLGR